jgi:tetratricopeptide (TPR) repeat protein
MALLFRFRATLGLLLLACLLTACQGVWGVNLRPTATPIGANLTTQGYEAYQAGDYAVALRTFTAAISANANDSGAYYGRGVTAYQLGDLQNAYSDFSQAMNLGFTPIAWVYESRGLVAFEQQQLEQALSDLRQAAKLDPQKAEIFWNLGRVLFATHNDLEALVQFNKAITLNPNVAAFYRARVKLMPISETVVWRWPTTAKPLCSTLAKRICTYCVAHFITNSRTTPLLLPICNKRPS